MNFAKHFYVFIVQALLAFSLLIQTYAHQDHSGFISIDCGLSGVSTYRDEDTGIVYSSDEGFTNAGVNGKISTEYMKDSSAVQQLLDVRIFPEGTRNCYNLKPKQGKGYRYLIRARFMYGNYDKKQKPPMFDLYIGPNLWTTVMGWKYPSTSFDPEIIHIPFSDYIDVCLVNTGLGTPFISALELRQIDSEIYLTEAGAALQLHGRHDYSSGENRTRRYEDDPYDRLWTSYPWMEWLNTSTIEASSITKNEFELPSAVMSTAYIRNSSSYYLGVTVYGLNTTSSYFLYMHFVELQKLQTNQIRQFTAYTDDGGWDQQVNPKYLSTITVTSRPDGIKSNSKGELLFWLTNTKSATLPPILNAMELYMLKELPLQETNQTDVEAIRNLKFVYGLKRNWQGDPCSPQDYQWTGLNCSYRDESSPRIVSVNLQSSYLTGEIAPSIANLTMLQNLDLSNNNLNGRVPAFLAQLPLLKVLNLTGNNFTCPVPRDLLRKNDWNLSLDQYLVDCESCPSCGNKFKVVPLAASLGALAFVALISGFIFWLFKRRRQNRHSNKGVILDVETVSMEPEQEDPTYGSTRKQITYSEIQQITGNFGKVLGEGGFGKVYHGYLNGNQVAVKMLSSASIEGRRQFHAELKLLLRVHHKNLTTLVGYCNEESSIGLIYEYMAKGNLRSHISGNSNIVLSWEARLRIAIDAAQGLEYLHNGCKPPIIHRDVKSTNILLTETFQAKLGDFGFSKIFPLEGATQTTSTGIASSIAGTPGYLDPEYYITNWLNEKSDVYSFGVVMLELITSRQVLGQTRENNHIIQWVSSMLAKGDIKMIVDPRLGGDYDINTVWKAIEISMDCVSKTSSTRPSMSQVTTDLKDCLVTELVRTNSHTTGLSRESSVELTSSTTVSEFSPTAR